MEKVQQGIAGLILGIGIIALYGYRFGFSDWSVYTPGRIIGLLFGVVCLVAGPIYLTLAILESRRDAAEADRRKKAKQQTER